MLQASADVTKATFAENFKEKLKKDIEDTLSILHRLTSIHTK